jgi:hypothetical protein
MSQKMMRSEPTMGNFDKGALHPTYIQLYEILDEDDDMLYAIWDRMSGQQVNFPEHMFAKEKIEILLANMLTEKANIDVVAISKQYGYSRRWIRDAVRKLQRGEAD